MSNPSGGSRGPEFVGGRAKPAGPRRPRRPKWPKWPKSNIPWRVRALLAVILVILLIPVLFFKSFFVYVQPDEFGVKESRVGINRGIQETVYTAGYVFVAPFGIERMHKFPRCVQVVELTAFDTPTHMSPARVFEPAAKIQTDDGFYVDVDVSILYRITDPYKLITTVGPGRLFLSNGVLPKAEPVLKQTLGELNTEEFYDSPLRVEKAQKARELLDEELQKNGIQVEHVLIRYFKYSDQIQENIEAKVLQDQLVFKNQAEARAATEEIQLRETETRGQANVNVTLEEGRAYKVEKDAERELYTRSREAEADLLVSLAEAKATELRNEAMRQLGADKKVAMTMAEVLEGLDTIVLPVGGASGFNPMDLEEILALFGVENGGAPPEGAAPAPPIATPSPTPPAAVETVAPEAADADAEEEAR